MTHLGSAQSSATQPTVALLDYGSGNVRSAQRAVEKVGATVSVTNDPYEALDADGLLVPGVGAFSACMRQLKSVNGDRIIGQRLAGGRPVLGICVGMQILFDAGEEFADQEDHGSTPGMGEWPGVITKLEANVLPHMGWNTVEVEEGSTMFAGGLGSERFYFVHSYAAREWELFTDGRTEAPKVHWAEHDGCRFVAAVENGPLWATQFHPEKSGHAGLKLLENWVGTL